MGRTLLRDVTISPSGQPVAPFTTEEFASITLRSAAPEIRLEETDQTSPAGGYRLKLDGDVLTIDRRATNLWATVTELVRIDEAAGVLQVTLSGSAPELRSAETDQTDPVGRFRFQGTGGSYAFSKALTANWATVQDLMAYDRPNTVWLFNALETNAWYFNFLAGVAATPGTNSRITIGGSTAASTGVRINTGDAIGAVVERIAILMGAAIVDIDINAANLDLNGYAVNGVGSLRGQGAGSLYIRGNKAITDATARRVSMVMLDPATDTEYEVAQAVPKAATPLWAMLAPVYVPTTSELDASNLTFVVDASDQLTAYWNKAGAIKSLVIGTLA